MSKEQQFPVLVTQHENQYVCVIKELFILEKGGNLAEVYEKVQRKKEEVLRQFQQAHLDSFLTPLQPIEKKRRRFSLNFLLLSLLLMIPVVSVTRPLAQILSRAAGFLQVKPIELVIRVSEHVERLPPEKKQELKHAIRSLTAEFEQFTQMNLEEKASKN